MTMSFPRRQFLAALRERPAEKSAKNLVARWAVGEGFAIEITQGRLSKFTITEAGRAAIADAELSPEERAAIKQLPRLAKRLLCREHSATEEAADRGGGFVYFTEPDHKPFPTGAARLLIEKGYVQPREDGLFVGMSQTFEVVSHA